MNYGQNMMPGYQPQGQQPQFIQGPNGEFQQYPLNHPANQNPIYRGGGKLPLDNKPY